MAAPNIVNTVTITGKLAVANCTTTQANVVANAASSGKVFRVNSLYISNIDTVSNADITVNIIRSAVNYAVANGVTVPAKASLAVIEKETMIYLEEGDGLAVKASVNGDLQAVCSYEEIS